MKAMILAAGRGGRMKPLTDTLPKCLLPVRGEPLVTYLLASLAKHGITEIVMNLHHLGDQIEATLQDGQAYGVHITYSYEPELLGTGGGVTRALPMLGADPFWVISGDLWTDYPFSCVPEILPGGVHLIMADNPDFHPEGDYHLAGDRLRVSGEPKLTYASFGIYHPQLFENAPEGNFCLTQLIREAIQKDRATGEHYRGEWINIGSPRELARLS